MTRAARSTVVSLPGDREPSCLPRALLAAAKPLTVERPSTASDLVSADADGDGDGAKPPPRRRQVGPRTVVLAGLAAVVVLVGAFVAVSVWPDPKPQVPNLAGSAFEEAGLIRTGAGKAAYSPDGTRIALLTDGGLGLAEEGRVRTISRKGAQIVDFAWMPDSRRVLVLEGPAATGFLAVLDLTGDVVASAELQPSFSPGAGHGIDVDRQSRLAVAVAVTRQPIGGRETRDIALIELQSGVVRMMVNATGDESRPRFVAGNAIAFTDRTADSTRVMVADPTTGRREALSPAQERASLVAVLDDGESVAYSSVGRDGRVRLYKVAVTGGDRELLMKFSAGEAVVAVDPSGRRALLSTSLPDPSGEGPGEAVLRDVVLDSAIRRR